MTNPTTSSLTAQDAAARIFAAAAELGVSRQEAILITKAVNAVRTGKPTDVPLTDTQQHRRRRIAHVVGTLLYDPALNPAEVVAVVTGASLATA
ncbi:hypothetical protein [Amycolatopsis vastitatis]|uniref:Uncharacterized protein n=1 Tax=Amycolatopsis vastitatis TaxID=1905142 RepID=A0A229TDX8_9PSEU|nr:hypothetical protein [Amycolatopsis vastitatis]OXM69343.1 hypothetical protein CF165_07370 [Amycolatopsis vastitatis]